MKEKIKVLFSDLWIAIRWGIILSLVMMGVLWLSDRLRIFDSMPSSESLIITFIGILATFVVVSNFSQVANIEEKADRKIKEIEKKVNMISKQCLDKTDSTSLASSIIQTKEMIDIIKGSDELKSLGTVKYEAKNEMKGELEDDIKRYERANLEEIDLRSFQMLKFANALINSKQKDILQKILLDTNALFKITYTRKGKIKQIMHGFNLKTELYSLFLKQVKQLLIMFLK